MKLLRFKTQVKEVGLIPTQSTMAGFTDGWEFPEYAQRNSPYRVGIVEHIGTSCEEVKEGMYVVFSSFHAVINDKLGSKNMIVLEQNIMGYYTGIQKQGNTFKMENVNFTPIGDRVLLKKEVATKKGGKPSKLVVPTSGSQPLKGIVVKIGPGFAGAPTVLKEGDKVMFGNLSGIEIDLEEGKFTLMREADVFGVL